MPAVFVQATANRDIAVALLTPVKMGGGPSDQLEAWYAEHDAPRVAKDIVVAARASDGGLVANYRKGKVGSWPGPCQGLALVG